MSAATNEELRRVKLLALRNGRTFSRKRPPYEDNNYFEAPPCSGDGENEEWKFPKRRLGYTFSSHRHENLTCSVRVDPRAVISLALISHTSPYLRAYATKTALMCVNVSRLIYTTDAFTHRNLNDDCVTDALEFYIGNDIDRLDMNKAPNERFSDLLHSLKTTGYEDYIFRLADRLELDVDLVKNGFLYRYVRNSCCVDESERRARRDDCGDRLDALNSYCRRSYSYFPVTKSSSSSLSPLYGGGYEKSLKYSEDILRGLSDVQPSTTSKSHGVITAVVTNDRSSVNRCEGDWFVRTSLTPVVKLRTT